MSWASWAAWRDDDPAVAGPVTNRPGLRGGDPMGGPRGPVGSLLVWPRRPGSACSSPVPRSPSAPSAPWRGAGSRAAAATADVVLDEPGVYVLPGLVTNPPLPSDDLPDVDLLAVDGTAAAPRPGRPPDGRQPLVRVVPAVHARARRLRRRRRRARRPGPLRRRQPVGHRRDDGVVRRRPRGHLRAAARRPRLRSPRRSTSSRTRRRCSSVPTGPSWTSTGPDRRRRPAPAHHGAVVVNVGLSFLRGMVATVNPCGFVLLPTYLMYFLGIEATRSDSERATVRRALLVGAAVTAGFMVVFVARRRASRSGRPTGCWRTPSTSRGSPASRSSCSASPCCSASSCASPPRRWRVGDARHDGAVDVRLRDRLRDGVAELHAGPVRRRCCSSAAASGPASSTAPPSPSGWACSSPP